MNELYGSERAPRSRRRWIYMLAAMIILCVLMIMPGTKTARLSLVIAKENPAEMVLNIPKDCRLEKVYLRAGEHAPRSGKLVTLVVNGMKFAVEDFEKLPEINVQPEAGSEFRNAPIDWEKLRGAKSLTVTFEDVNQELQRYDLDLVFEITGNPDKIKNWQSFVQLYSKGAVVLPGAAAEKSQQ